MPFTIPELLPIVAIPVLVLLHTPPVATSLKVVAALIQTFSVPVIAAGVEPEQLCPLSMYAVLTA